MKILLALHPILDPGGIINHTHHLAEGLREIGHEVDITLFQDIHQSRIVNYEVNQKKLPYNRVIGYKDDITIAINYMKSFDLIVWEIPVPTQMKPNAGNNKWPELYNSGVPQLAVVHDAHIVDRTPWIYHIHDKFKAFIPVQTCGATSLFKLPVANRLIVNPFDLSENLHVPFKDKEDGFISICNFKNLKHMEDLVMAVPFLDKHIRVLIGGGGIEQCYMASKDKCRSRYIVNGEKIWDKALTCGMEYLGFIQNEERIKLYNNIKFVIDPSWSQAYVDKGGSLTRVFIEAVICGTVPIARQEFVDPHFFKAWENYIPISIKHQPREIANVIKNAMAMSENDYNTIVKNNLKISGQFDRKVVAQQYIDLLTNPDTPVLVGKYYEDVELASKLGLKFFGIIAKPNKKTGVNKWFK